MPGFRQPPPTAFKPGHPGGPGRPPGMRNRLSETMLALLQADASEHGAQVIAEVRQKDPSTWLRCMCALLPRQVQVEKFGPLTDWSDEELQALEQYLRAGRARPVDIDGKAEPASRALIPEPLIPEK